MTQVVRSACAPVLIDKLTAFAPEERDARGRPVRGSVVVAVAAARLALGGYPPPEFVFESELSCGGLVHPGSPSLRGGQGTRGVRVRVPKVSVLYAGVAQSGRAAAS